MVTANLGVVRANIPALSENPKVSGLLLFRDPTSLPLDHDSRVAMANWFSLRKFLSGGEYKNLPGLLQWVTGRPDLAIASGSYGLEDFRIEVDDWHYVRERIVHVLGH